MFIVTSMQYEQKLLQQASAEDIWGQSYIYLNKTNYNASYA